MKSPSSPVASEIARTYVVLGAIGRLKILAAPPVPSLQEINVQGETQLEPWYSAYSGSLKSVLDKTISRVAAKASVVNSY